MRKILLIALSIMLFTACSKNDDVINEEEVVIKADDSDTSGSGSDSSGSGSDSSGSGSDSSGSGSDSSGSGSDSSGSGSDSSGSGSDSSGSGSDSSGSGSDSSGGSSDSSGSGSDSSGGDANTNWKDKTYKVNIKHVGGNPPSYCYYEENGVKVNERHFARNSSYTKTDGLHHHTYSVKPEVETIKFVVKARLNFYLNISVDGVKLVAKRISEKTDGNHIINFEYNFKTKTYKVDSK